MTVATHLALWALGLADDDVPDEVRDAACRQLLDGVGTAVAAARTGAGGPAVTVAGLLGGPRRAAVIGSTGPKLSAPAAAFANGALVHALDYDGTHPAGVVHATAPVLAAAFAAGQDARATGREVLLASVAGLEAVCRIAAAVPHAFHARGLHATGMAGVFGAALASARLLGLDVQQTVHALGIAGSSSSGLLECLNTGAETKLLHPGSAAAGGVLAAWLARAGATGPDTVFEGEFGFYRAFAGRSVAPHQVIGGLGERWELPDITVKQYPCCELIHASLRAAATAAAQMAEAGLGPDDIESVKVAVPKESIPLVGTPDKAAPRSVYEAKFSLAWSVAAMLVDGSVDVDTYAEGCTRRTAPAELAQRVRISTVRCDGPAVSAPGELTVRFRGGRRLRVDEPGLTAVPDEAVTAKFHANAGGMTSDSELLAAKLRALGTVSRIGPLIELTAKIAAPRG